MPGRTCIITGSSSGLGKGTANLLAKRGEKIVLLSRRNERGEKTLEELKKLNKRGAVHWIPTDLASFDSISDFAIEFKSLHKSLDILFNCAGIITLRRELTDEGLESMFAVNYLGHFLLTNLLYDSLKTGAPSRVITVSGRGHKPSIFEGKSEGSIDFENLQGKKKFNFIKAAKQSVLARIMLTYQLAERWGDEHIYAATISPGLTNTGLTDHLPWYARAYYKFLKIAGPAQNPEEAAAHIVDLGLRPHPGRINGKYYEVDRRNKVLHQAKSSNISYNRKMANKLWTISKKLSNMEDY